VAARASCAVTGALNCAMEPSRSTTLAVSACTDADADTDSAAVDIAAAPERETHEPIGRLLLLRSLFLCVGDGEDVYMVNSWIVMERSRNGYGRVRPCLLLL
jgi:hypothetical protein